MNTKLKILMWSDVTFNTGFGLIAPLMAFFITTKIEKGTILTVGLATALYMIVKALVQLPFSRLVDQKNHTFSLIWLVVGSFMLIFTPFIYLLATHIYHIYLAQIIYGLGAGLANPTWLGLWSANLDQNQASYEWSLYSTLVTLGASFSAIIGAFSGR